MRLPDAGRGRLQRLRAACHFEANRKAEIKRGAAAHIGFRPDAAAVAFHDFSCDRKSHACAFNLAAMQALEKAENSLGVLLLEALAVIRDRNDPLGRGPLG